MCEACWLALSDRLCAHPGTANNQSENLFYFVLSLLMTLAETQIRL